MLHALSCSHSGTSLLHTTFTEVTHMINSLNIIAHCQGHLYSAILTFHSTFSEAHKHESATGCLSELITLKEITTHKNIRRQAHEVMSKSKISDPNPMQNNARPEASLTSLTNRTPKTSRLAKNDSPDKKRQTRTLAKCAPLITQP